MRILSIRETLWFNATPEAVWRLLEPIEEWPRWNRAIARAGWQGLAGWSEGNRFSVAFHDRPRPWHGLARVDHVEPRRELHWRARILGFRSRYILRLEVEGGGTRVTFESQLEGLAARLASGRPIARHLARFLRSFLESLRETSEYAVGQL